MPDLCPSACQLSHALLVGLPHSGSVESACDETLPRVTTYAAMRGLWRPSLTASEFGLVVVSVATDGTVFCGLTVKPDAEISAPLAAGEIADGLYATQAVEGPWEAILAAVADLRQHSENTAEWHCLFHTNPRSTEPAEWKSEVRLKIRNTTI